MDNLKLQYFTDFLLLMGWTPIAEGKWFREYQPPQHLGLPADYFLELPKDDSKKGFREYAKGIIGILSKIYHCDVEDLQIVLEKGHKLFSMGIANKTAASPFLTKN
ncbi:hypothetical protein PN36_14235 [Candidatus Thiomargarita nelsonii]|uniref:Uncharacterized protein n=1 Tax=Candidatus Thiomargarita nelsonii TaxID=1003181 RepID=A0A0A6P4E1_9GAMM|nr:hypothetical protein PN36_14235 [Candidatus Thiomargarita nelsonii]